MTVTAYTSPLAVWAATDAGFRSWGKAWTDMLDTMGLTQEYSNIDWATVTMPTVAGTWAGGRVYRLNDSVSTTREVYVLVEFGRPSTTSATFGFGVRVTVGTQHTAGVVTGYSMSHYLSMTQAPSDGGDIIGVRSDHGFSIFTNAAMGTAFQGGFAVERLRSAGVATPDGVVMLVSGAAANSGGSNLTSPAYQVANYAGGNVFSNISPVSSTSSARAFENVSAIRGTVDPSYAGKAPAVTMDTFGKYDPCFHWILVSKYLYSPATEFNATINGETGTYRTPATGFLADNGSTSTSLLYLALRVS